MKIDSNTNRGRTLPKEFLDVPAEIISDKTLTSTEKLIFEIVYTTTATAPDFNVPSKNIANYLGVSVAAVKLAFKDMFERGYLERGDE